MGICIRKAEKLLSSVKGSGARSKEMKLTDLQGEASRMGTD